MGGLEGVCSGNYYGLISNYKRGASMEATKGIELDRLCAKLYVVLL